jgi:hypothetical protein
LRDEVGSEAVNPDTWSAARCAIKKAVPEYGCVRRRADRSPATAMTGCCRTA